MNQEQKLKADYASKKRIEDMRDAIEKLSDIANSSLTTSDEICEAFAFTHSYLLNSILTGAMKNVLRRKGDGRLLPQLIKCSEEIWG